MLPSAAALALVAAVSAPPVGPGAVTLVQPATGAVLYGGDLATIEWSPAAHLPGGEEWEAFLSVDDGRTWAYRVTPHLDLAPTRRRRGARPPSPLR